MEVEAQLTRWLEFRNVGAAFLSVVEQFLAHTPWPEVALIEVWIFDCGQKKTHYTSLYGERKKLFNIRDIKATMRATTLPTF